MTSDSARGTSSARSSRRRARSAAAVCRPEPAEPPADLVRRVPVDEGRGRREPMDQSTRRGPHRGGASGPRPSSARRSSAARRACPSATRRVVPFSSSSARTRSNVSWSIGTSCARRPVPAARQQAPRRRGSPRSRRLPAPLRRLPVSRRLRCGGRHRCGTRGRRGRSHGCCRNRGRRWGNGDRRCRDGDGRGGDDHGGTRDVHRAAGGLAAGPDARGSNGRRCAVLALEAGRVAEVAKDDGERDEHAEHDHRDRDPVDPAAVVPLGLVGRVDDDLCHRSRGARDEDRRSRGDSYDELHGGRPETHRRGF